MSYTHELSAPFSSFLIDPRDGLALVAVNALYNEIQEDITRAQQTTSTAYEAEQWAAIQEELNRQREQLHNCAIQMQFEQLQARIQDTDAGRVSRQAARTTPAIPAYTPAPPPTPRLRPVDLVSTRSRVPGTGVIEPAVRRETAAGIDPSAEVAMGTFEMRAQIASFIHLLRRLERYHCLDPTYAGPIIQFYMQQAHDTRPDPLETARLVKEQRDDNLRHYGYEGPNLVARAQERLEIQLEVDHGLQPPAEFQRQRERALEELRHLLRQSPVPDSEYDSAESTNGDEEGGPELSHLPELMSGHASLSSDEQELEPVSPRTATIRAQFPLYVTPSPPSPPRRPQPQMSTTRSASRRRGRGRSRLDSLERQPLHHEERPGHPRRSHAPSRGPLHHARSSSPSRALQLSPSSLRGRGIVMPQLDPSEVDGRGFAVLRTREQIRSFLGPCHKIGPFISVIAEVVVTLLLN
ncbi:hypothetical protein K505DRAFT_340033 [Melanomma pulvis-pyrius CBS 109.77]|uniref:Uncharacterized protein n=1 Tax=Melanomma pulvis-pyrius CBS 109.77 TaxID=1314802 RepID=A0A6A6X4R7_9PLEO|nr:hypothetical protein K505DRAFT_340033 [Melanomma pulvis-pyrius CBS 109.77]